MMNRSRIRCWLGALVLVFSVVVTYLPALDAGFIWDDDSNVTGNFNLHDLDGLRRIWTNATWNQQQYYPLTHTSFWVEYQLWGLNPLGYHLVNVALHAMSSLLLWRILLRLGVPGAGLAAAIFALHPLQVESVAWVTERKNTLSAVFFLAAAFAGIAFSDAADIGRPRRGPASRRWWWYVLCFCLFLCAVLAKTATCMLPVVLALLLWWKKGRVTLRDLLPLLPLTLLGAAAGLQTAWLEQHHVGAVGADFSSTLSEKVLIAGRASWFYIGKTLLPTGLCFIYPRWRIDAADATAYLYPVTALATLGILWGLRMRIGRGPLAAALYFAVMIFPALGFFKLYFMKYSFVQDHFQYLAGIGPIVLLSAGVATAHTAVRTSHFARQGSPVLRLSPSPILMTAALVLLLPLALATWERSKVFLDSETLWRDTVEENPTAWMAHSNLGVLLMAQGRVEAAVEHYRETLKLRPENTETWVNLGNALLSRGDTQEAVDHFRRATELTPGLFEAHFEANLGLGVALERAGRTAEAEKQFEKTMTLNPHGAEAFFYLARLRLQRGEADSAGALLENLLRRKPSLSKAHSLYGDVLAAQGKAREAEGHFRDAILLDPTEHEGHFGLGVMLASRGSLVEAAASFSRALTIKPDYAEAHYNLGKVLDLAGDTAEAVRRYRLAIGTSPRFAEAHNNLGVDLLLLGETESGVSHLREALRLKPDFLEARINLERSADRH